MLQFNTGKLKKVCMYLYELMHLRKAHSNEHEITYEISNYERFYSRFVN